MGRANILAAHTKTIIEAYIAGQTTIELAKRFCCSDSAIWQLLKRENIPTRDRSHSARKFTFDSTFFDVIDTPDKAYILGLLFADGCNHEKTNRVLLTLIDKELVEDVTKAMKATNVLEVINKPSPQKTAYCLRISSRHMCARLTSLGCTPNKSLTVRYPEISSDLDSHFIRGYFDGDGSFYMSGRKKTLLSVSICGTYNFLETLAARSNILTNIRQHGRISELEIRSHSGALAFGEYLYKDATILLERKYAKWKSAKLALDLSRNVA